jgi:hypothetical protein
MDVKFYINSSKKKKIFFLTDIYSDKAEIQGFTYV